MAPVPGNPTTTCTDHGVPGLCCTPAKASDIALFFLVNYLAHCATIKFFPAETPTEKMYTIITALLCPSSGLLRAIDSILRRPRLRKLNAIQRALKSGALCMVTRSHDWRPRLDDKIHLTLRNIGKNSRDNKTDFR